MPSLPHPVGQIQREFTVNHKSNYNIQSNYDLHSLRLVAEDTSSYRLSDKFLCLGEDVRRDLSRDVPAHEHACNLVLRLLVSSERSNALLRPKRAVSLERHDPSFPFDRG